MLKILHTADWHLGKKLDTFSRLAEQEEVLDEICRIADNEKVDVIIIAGDLFDNANPSNEAVNLFYKTIKRLTQDGQRAVVAIAGNHDSPDRIAAPDPLARECGIFLAGYPNSVQSYVALATGLRVLHTDKGFLELQLPNDDTPLRLLLTPYANEIRLRTYLGNDNPELQLQALLQQNWQHLADTYCDDKGVNLLVAHLYMMQKGGDKPEEPEGENAILHVGAAQAIFSEIVPPQIQYVALGHLHRYQTIDKIPCPMVYSSSPLAYSFSEAGQQKYVVLVEAEAAKPVQYKAIPLAKGKPLFRKKFSHTTAALEWLEKNPDALIELTISTEKYLTAEENRLLRQAHDGIVGNIIPEIKDSTGLEASTAQTVDLSKSMEDLFVDYFQHKYKQAPNDDLLALMKEILHQQVN